VDILNTLARWSPQLRLYAVGVGLGLIPSVLSVLSALLHGETRAGGVAVLLQVLAWLGYVGTVLGALVFLGHPRRRWMALGLITIAILTALAGSYYPAVSPSI
jgi:hypothetical protein